MEHNHDKQKICRLPKVDHYFILDFAEEAFPPMGNPVLNLLWEYETFQDGLCSSNSEWMKNGSK